MRSWNFFVGLLGNKFWKLYRHDGFIRAFLRGRVNFFTSIQKGGPGSDPSKLVGTDEYGNQYFEDLDTNYYINRRWVEFAENHKWMSLQHLKIPPPYNGWLCYTYDEFPNKKNFVEPSWRPAKSEQMRHLHPLTSNFHMAPGARNNPLKHENEEFHKQKTYLSWEPPKHENKVDVYKYDHVDKYDITKH